ncbi:MAG TPA: hypothetical protein VNI84_03860 [Pyrinomonadaceae bacterium]|nr:hypothetical protein [Pyrinomonadaceae bacterium]
MMIKNFGARVESVWEGLRPLTKKMLVGVIEANHSAPQQKFSYDAHADWELSRLLSALDEQTKDLSVRRNTERLGEIKAVAETCADVLEAQTESAEVFIQLATRAIERNDFKKIDALADILFDRFPAGEIAEVVRQTELAQIRAVAYETLAQLPTQSILPLLDDSIYYDIVRNTLEQQAFEFDNEEARQIVEQLEFEDTGGE